MFNDKIKSQGVVSIELRGPDGELKEEREVKNLVTDQGLAFIADRMSGTPTKVAMSHLGLGTDTTAPAGAQTALLAELQRVAISSETIVTTSVADDAIQYVATFPAGSATGALKEAGMFNAAAAGEMRARVVFPVINKGDNDSITITWKITQSAGS